MKWLILWAGLSPFFSLCRRTTPWHLLNKYILVRWSVSILHCMRPTVQTSVLYVLSLPPCIETMTTWKGICWKGLCVHLLTSLLWHCNSGYSPSNSVLSRELSLAGLFCAREWTCLYQDESCREHNTALACLLHNHTNMFLDIMQCIFWGFR